VRKFIARALEKLPKLDKAQIQHLLEDLAAENEQLELVLDSMNQGVLVADSSHRLILVNKPAERLLPLASEPVEGRLWHAILDEDISRFVRTALETEETIEERVFSLGSSGGTRQLAFAVMPLVREGAVHGTIVHVEDVTERRAREARLRRAENLASLTTLAAGVAHEIKNPLGSIGIHMQLVEKSLQQHDHPERERLESYINVVNEEVDRLNRIVVDFLFAVRPMDTELAEEDLNAIVDGLLSFLRYELEEAGIELRTDFDQSIPKLELDDKYVKQAILNIVKNAISAMPDGGVLTVRTRNLEDEVELEIRDTGHGMSEEVMEKIFEPYFTTKDFGSGIGLTLVYKIVKEHLGEIAVDSKEGQGTSFTISLPVPQRERHLLEWSSGDGDSHEV
jgi:PAS domain S-box-containing protein